MLMMIQPRCGYGVIAPIGELGKGEKGLDVDVREHHFTISRLSSIRVGYELGQLTR